MKNTNSYGFYNVLVIDCNYYYLEGETFSFEISYEKFLLL